MTFKLTRSSFLITLYRRFSLAKSLPSFIMGPSFNAQPVLCINGPVGFMIIPCSLKSSDIQICSQKYVGQEEWGNLIHSPYSLFLRTQLANTCKISKRLSNQSLGREVREREGDSWPRNSKPQSICISGQESRIADLRFSLRRGILENRILNILLKPSIGVIPLGNSQAGRE